MYAEHVVLQVEASCLCTTQFLVLQRQCLYAGDGECGFRAMAVGAIMAVHRLPNWQTAAPAFAQHMGSLFDSVRAELKQQQQAHSDGATAQQGLRFFQVLQGVHTNNNCAVCSKQLMPFLQNTCMTCVCAYLSVCRDQHDKRDCLLKE